jgi:ADP-ribose pyrophosphatase YjhB (NUDIX family)
MSQRKIRAVALGVALNGDRVLVRRHLDGVLDPVFYRPVGGTIEFGEHSTEAVRREVREEIGAELVNLRLLACVENLFDYQGAAGHEITFIYRGDFADPALYQREAIPGHEDDGQDFVAVWLPLDAFTPEEPLYPTALLDLLRRELAPPDELFS